MTKCTVCDRSNVLPGNYKCEGCIECERLVDEGTFYTMPEWVRYVGMTLNEEQIAYLIRQATNLSTHFNVALGADNTFHESILKELLPGNYKCEDCGEPVPMDEIVEHHAIFCADCRLAYVKKLINGLPKTTGILLTPDVEYDDLNIDLVDAMFGKDDWIMDYDQGATIHGSYIHCITRGIHIPAVCFKRKEVK